MPESSTLWEILCYVFILTYGFQSGPNLLARGHQRPLVVILQVLGEMSIKT